MSLVKLPKLIQFISCPTCRNVCRSGISTTITRNFAAKPKIGKGKGMGVGQQRKYLDVETDPEKLCNYLVGGNVFKEGEDPKLKPDEEYPDWLWTLRTERDIIPLEDLEYDSQEYWDRLLYHHQKKLRMRSKTMHKYKIY